MGGKGSGGNSKPCKQGCQCRRHKRGAERYNWTGDGASYVAKHFRVRRTLGKASNYICECGKQAAHWALTHDSSGLSTNDFRPLCVSCHREYDRDSYVGSRNSQAKLTPSQIAEIRNAYATGQYTQQSLADQYGVCQTQIGKIVRLDSWDY